MPTRVRNLKPGQVCYRAAVKAMYLVTAIDSNKDGSLRVSWVKLEGDGAGALEWCSYDVDGLYDLRPVA